MPNAEFSELGIQSYAKYHMARRFCRKHYKKLFLHFALFLENQLPGLYILPNFSDFIKTIYKFIFPNISGLNDP